MTLGLAIVASLSLALQAVPGTVQGVVRDATDGAPVPGAEIRLIGTGRSAVADEHGRYLLTGVPGGPRRLQARRLGFEPLEVDLAVPYGGVVAVEFHLESVAIPLPTVNAEVAALLPPDDPHENTATRPDMPPHSVIRVLDASPGVTELGIAAGVKALLGPDPPAPDNVLYVRGAGASLDLMLLDGAPVHAPFHLGGLVDPGLPPSVRRAQRLQGGVTARYDGGLADVLLLESDPGAAGTHGSLFLDMLATGGSFETHDADVGAVFASYRSLHGSGEGGLLNAGFPQRYADALVRSDLYVGDADTLSITLFSNEETVRLGTESVREEPRWGNKAGSMRYRTATVFGQMELGGSLGYFDTRLPVGAAEPLIATGSTRRLRAWADFQRQAGSVRLGYGLQGDRLGLRTVFRESEDAETPIRLRQKADAGAVGVWVEGQRALFGNLDLMAGLRGNFFTDGMPGSLSPRLQVGYQLADDLRLTGSMGRFHQLVVTVDTDLPIERTVFTSDDGRLLGTVLSQVAAARSTHLVLGITHAPGPRSLLRVETYYKSSSDVPEYGDGALRTAGFDVEFSRPLTETFGVWGTYNLGWAWAEYPDAPREDVYSARHFLRGGVTFDSPSQVRLDADLSMGEGLEFGAIPRSERAAVTPESSTAPGSGSGSGSGSGGAAPGGSGTAPPKGTTSSVRGVPGVLSISGPIEGGAPIFTRAPNGSYLRLNLQVTVELDVNLFGRDQQMLPYFRIVNALDRRDALFFQFDGDDGAEPRPIGSVPILPVIGLEWRF